MVANYLILPVGVSDPVHEESARKRSTGEPPASRADCPQMDDATQRKVLLLMHVHNPPPLSC